MSHLLIRFVLVLTSRIHKIIKCVARRLVLAHEPYQSNPYFTLLARNYTWLNVLPLQSSRSHPATSNRIEHHGELSNVQTPPRQTRNPPSIRECCYPRCSKLWMHRPQRLVNLFVRMHKAEYFLRFINHDRLIVWSGESAFPQRASSSEWSLAYGSDKRVFSLMFLFS